MTANAFDTGNIAFMLVAASLVMLMTPGLAFFYGGLVGRKNVLAIMIQSFVSMGWTTFLWWACGFSMVFSGGEGQIIGNLKLAFLHGVRPDSLITVNEHTASAYTLSLLVLFVYQMMFAIITPALITGAFANRIKFPAYLIFLTLWLFFVYFPIAHMVWGNGLFAKWGVLDFAGGTAVHTTAGFAALASVIYVGKRKYMDKGPHSIPLVALGTGLLWFGWYGFNAGSELHVDQTTLVAFANTDICASVAAITWLAIAWKFEKKPKFVGLLTGAVAGLVAITPAAGYVSPTGAVVIGFIVSVVCYMAVELKKHLGLDDALDVWGCHGVGGVVGCICTGIFATTVWNAGGADGLLRGGVRFFGVEVVSVVITMAYAFLFSYVALWLIDKVTAVKVTDEEEELGLDASLHGEEAYL
jgi:Amt family ammonium transporter